MNQKKKGAKDDKPVTPAVEADQSFGAISSKADLKKFLQDIRDKMAEGIAPAINAMSAMNYVLNLSEINDLLNEENKEIARDIWLRLRQSGIKIKNPPMLFGEEDSAVAAR